MRINTNLTALNTYNSYTAANNKIASSVAKLSSGYAINSAADNAAGLAISEKMRAQVRGLDKASSNSQTAISLAQTAEGSLESSGQILQRMREISVQSSSDTNEDNIDREALQAEFSQLNSELDEIASDSTFNNQHLLNGNLATKTITSGSGTSLSGSGMKVSFGNANAGTYGFGVRVVTTSDTITGNAPTALNISNSTVNSYFSGVDTTAANTAINSTSHSTLLNGNYKITDATVGEDGTITVTAKGDNNQTFTSTLTKADYEGATNAADSYTLNFGTADAFKITFTKAAGIGTGLSSDDSKITDLANAFKGTEFTVSGGVADKAAQKAVYATMTGADAVELKAGMDSVTFNNGVSVSFQKLTAADLDTTLKVSSSSETAVSGTDYDPATSLTGTVSQGTSSAAAKAEFDLAGTSSSYAGTMVFTVGSNDYSIDVSDGDDAGAIAGKLAAKLQESLTSVTTGSSTPATFAKTGVSVSGTKITFTANAVGETTDAAAPTFSLKTADCKIADYSFESVFGDATAGVSSSTIEAKSSSNSGLTIQVGANTGDEMEINIERADSEYLGVKGLDVSTQESASKAVDVVNKAINQVSSQRAYLGAVQNRLTYKIDNLTTSSQNLTSAESSIRDVDMASEMTKFTNAQILSQASTAMLAQANSLPQNVLSLLK